MMPLPRPNDLPPDQAPPIRPEEKPPASRTEALERAVRDCWFGTDAQVQLRGAKGVITIGIPILDRENKKRPIEVEDGTWEEWRKEAYKILDDCSKNVVPLVSMYKERVPVNELRAMGSGEDFSSAISYPKDQHVQFQSDVLRRSQIENAVDTLRPLAGELYDILVEREILRDREPELDDVVPLAPPMPARPPTRAVLRVPEQEPEEEEQDGDE